MESVNQCVIQILRVSNEYYMKLQDTPAHEDAITLIKERLGKEILEQVLLSFATMADIMGRHLIENEKDYSSMPKNVLYALMQTGHYLRIMGMALHDPEKLKNGIKALHFTAYDPTNDIEAEERFIFLVKEFHKMLQAEGKL